LVSLRTIRGCGSWRRFNNYDAPHFDGSPPNPLLERMARARLVPGSSRVPCVPPLMPKPLGGHGFGRTGVAVGGFTIEGLNCNVSQQYWTLPAGRKWLAVEYIYTR